MRLDRIATAMAAVLSLSGCFEFDPLVSACEKRIIERLKAPSSYKRFSVDKTSRVLYRGEYLGKVLEGIKNGEFSEYAKNVMMRYDNGKLVPEYITITIRYDAMNSFGTPLRLSTSCTAFIENGNTSNFRPWMLELSGD